MSEPIQVGELLPGVVATVTMPAARPRATKSRNKTEKAWAALRSGPLVK